MIKLSYSDCLILAQGEELDNLEGIKTKSSGVNIFFPQESVYANLADLKIDYSGKIPLKNSITEDYLLANKQDLLINFSNLKVDIPAEFSQVKGSKELITKLTTIDQFIFNMKYDPVKKKLSVDKYKIDAPLISLDLSEELAFVGESLEEIKMLSGSVNSEFEFKGNGLEIGNPESTGKYILGSIKSKTDLKMDKVNLGILEMSQIDPQLFWQEYLKFLGQGEVDFKMEGFKAEFAGDLKERLSYNPLVIISGVNLEELSLDQWAINYQIEENQVKFEQFNLDTSVVDFNLKGGLAINENNIGNSVIDNLSLRLGGFNENIKMIINTLEIQLGQKLPTDGDDLLIELTGTLNNPQIKGLNSQGAQSF